jgi:hypothetical protein
MRRISSFLAFLAVISLVVPSATAQTPAPKPGPEVAKLDYLAGNWISDGDMKPGPMGPGGKFTQTTDIHWMEGNFFLVMHAKVEGAMGKWTSIAVMGYDQTKKAYTYNEFDSTGDAGASVGTVDGDTWTFTSDENMGGTTFKGRYTMKVLSPTSYTYKYEMSKDGTTWTTAMDGKATKK